MTCLVSEWMVEECVSGIYQREIISNSSSVCVPPVMYVTVVLCA